MPQIKRISIVFVLFFIILFSLSPLTYLFIRRAPVSFWVIDGINRIRRSVPIKYIYNYLFAEPMKLFFPDQSGNFIYPASRDIVLLSNKNIKGEYYYEGYGKVVNLEKIQSGGYEITIQFNSGRIESMYFFNGSSVYFNSHRSGAVSSYNYKFEWKQLPSESASLGYVRVRFLSTDPWEDYLKKDNKTTSNKESIKVLLSMPNWHNYK